MDKNKKGIEKIEELYKRAGEIEWEAQCVFCKLLIKLMKSKGISENEVIYVYNGDREFPSVLIKFRAYYSKESIVIRYMCNDFKEGYYDCFSHEVNLDRGNLMILYDAVIEMG